jgi:hypothetical protein
MDINGAKALKSRLGLNGADEASAAAARVDIPADAPPVYHWLGVGRTAPVDPPAAEDDPTTTRVSLFRRLGLSFR